MSAVGDRFAQNEGMLLLTLRWGEGGADLYETREIAGGSQLLQDARVGRRSSSAPPPSVSCLGGSKRPMIRASKTRLNNHRTAPLVTPPPSGHRGWLAAECTRGRKL